MAFYNHYRGREQALAWLDAHERIGPEFFTGTGWRTVAIALAEGGRWDDAARYLASLGDEKAAECADLDFVDGVTNASLTLPMWMRPHTLTGQIFQGPAETLQSPEATSHRNRALKSFDRAAQTMHRLGESRRGGVAEEWRIWLLLTDPSTRQTGQELVACKMTEGSSAVEFVELAYGFGIEFDSAPLERHLRIRDLSGGVSPQELSAKLSLYRRTAHAISRGTRPIPRKSAEDLADGTTAEGACLSVD